MYQYCSATVWQLVWHCLSFTEYYVSILFCNCLTLFDTVYHLQDNIMYQYCSATVWHCLTLFDTDWQCISNCKIILCINIVLQLFDNLSDTVYHLQNIMYQYCSATVWHCLTLFIIYRILCINIVLQLSDTVWHCLSFTR